MQAQPPGMQAFTEDDLREMVLRLAHEIRNPLATIQSAVQLLEHRHQPAADDLELYESIYTEVSRLDRVVRDMQALVRLSTRTAMLVNLEQAVAAAVENEICRAQSRRDDICVVGGPEVVVLIDPRPFEAALCELLDNALRFSLVETPVEIAWRLLEGDLVAVDFDDRGPGISEENSSRILRPFFSTSTQGTGLGLSIVARTAQLAGGRLEWGNRDGGGTRFSLLLPVVPDARDTGGSPGGS